jgi:hypothetical protein
MRRAFRIMPSPFVFAAIGVAICIAPEPARAQLGSLIPTTQFELAENVQLDRADSAVLGQLERVKAYLADRQWNEAVETLRQLMESSEGKLLEVAGRREPPERFVRLSDFCSCSLPRCRPKP